MTKRQTNQPDPLYCRSCGGVLGFFDAERLHLAGSGCIRHQITIVCKRCNTTQTWRPDPPALSSTRHIWYTEDK